MKKYFVLPLLFFALAVTAQSNFQTTYGGLGELRDQGYDLVSTEEGYLLFGTSNSFGDGSFSMYLLAVDHNGEQLWSKTYQMAGGDDEGFAIAGNSTDGYVLLGKAEGAAGDQLLRVIKVDAEGNEIWAYAYPLALPSQGWDIEQVANDGYVFTGVSVANEMYVGRIAANGELLWTYTNGYLARGFNVEPLADGGFAVAGITTGKDINGNVTHFQFNVVKLDAQGVAMWEFAHQPDNASYSRAFDLTEVANGELVVLGSRSDTGDENYRMYIARLSHGGQLMNEKVIEKPGSHKGNYDVIETSDGNFVFVGNTTPPTGERSGYLLKTDPEFEPMWERNFGEEMGNNTLLLSGIEAMDGGLALLGGIEIPISGTANEGNTDIYMIKTNAEGTFEDDPISSGLAADENNLIGIYPMPTTGNSVTIKFGELDHDFSQPIDIEIIEQAGAVIASQTIRASNSSYTINDIDKLATGLYFVKLKYGTKIAIKRLMIN